MTTLAEYMRMPWTVDVEGQDDEDGVWLEATARELPGLRASARASDDIQAALYEALECHLGAMISDGVAIAVPAGHRHAPTVPHGETRTSLEPATQFGGER